MLCAIAELKDSIYHVVTETEEFDLSVDVTNPSIEFPVAIKEIARRVGATKVQLGRKDGLPWFGYVMFIHL